jgi:hypothetical protein
VVYVEKRVRHDGLNRTEESVMRLVEFTEAHTGANVALNAETISYVFQDGDRTRIMWPGAGPQFSELELAEAYDSVMTRLRDVGVSGHKGD